MILPRATSVERSLTSGFSNVTLAWGEKNGSRFCLVEDYSIKLHEVGLGAYSVSICWTVQQRKKHIYIHGAEHIYYISVKTLTMDVHTEATGMWSVSLIHLGNCFGLEFFFLSLE